MPAPPITAAEMLAAAKQDLEVARAYLSANLAIGVPRESAERQIEVRGEIVSKLQQAVAREEAKQKGPDT